MPQALHSTLTHPQDFLAEKENKQPASALHPGLPNLQAAWEQGVWAGERCGDKWQSLL